MIIRVCVPIYDASVAIRFRLSLSSRFTMPSPPDDIEKLVVVGYPFGWEMSSLRVF